MFVLLYDRNKFKETGHLLVTQQLSIYIGCFFLKFHMTQLLGKTKRGTGDQEEDQMV